MPTNLPQKIPAAYILPQGVVASNTVTNTGGYDFALGGIGFRQGTDLNMPYKRTTEPTTIHRIDQSLEPGEQTLSQLPWIKSQSSFHAGAGQQNLEAPFTAFQYQQEQVAHIRFDTSLGVDVWTPGQVKRLPDTTFSAFGFAATSMVCATVGGVDYAIIGGAQSLYQLAFTGGPDAAPVVTQIDLSSSTYGGISNCTVSSLTTDGYNYYAVLQLAVAGFVANCLTYVITGAVNSSAAPTALYQAPNSSSLSSRTNLCTNPSFETNATGYSNGLSGASVAVSAAQHSVGTQSLLSTWGTSTARSQSVLYPFTAVVGTTYTVTASIYVPSGGNPAVVLSGGQVGYLFPSVSMPTTATNTWQTITYTWTATTTNQQIGVLPNAAATVGQTCYIDAVLLEVAPATGTYFDGGKTADAYYTYAWTGTANASTSTATPLPVSASSKGVVGWVKERLMAGLNNKMYELPVAGIPAQSTLPTPRYSHPVGQWTWSAISDSPDSVLAAGATGNQASILKMTLDTTGATPVLAGASTVATLPLGETINVMQSYLGSYVALGTNKGVRVASFDTYSGNMVYGPLSVVSTAPVYGLCGADRFVYAGYSNQQADGHTGLVRIDLSLQIDSSGRLAYAPDLRPPSTAPTGKGTVTAVSVLPLSGRVMFLTPEGIHVQGAVPGNDSGASYWLRTSRIRYDTVEPKIYKMGTVRGTLDSASITVTGVTPFGGNTALGTFGPISGGNPGPFGLPPGLNEWIQLQFTLNGSGCVFNSYQCKAIPAPSRQHLIQVTGLCFTTESDRYGNTSVNALTPRQRYQAVKDLESSGVETTFTEFQSTGQSISTQVVIDQIDFVSFDRPAQLNDFSGFITFHLRETQT